MKLFKIGNAAEESKHPLRVFLSHSYDDKKIVCQYSARLASDGFIPWLDEDRILPGQDWENIIRRATRESHVVVVFLSASSVTKEGYVQKEIRLVLDVADEETIFVIPARLEPCEVPERLRGLLQVDLFDSKGYERMAAALRRREQQVREESTGRTSPGSATPSQGETVRPSDNSIVRPKTIPRNTRRWSRADRIALMIFAATALGLPGIYLAVPGAEEYVRNKLAGLHFDNASKHGLSPLAKLVPETDDSRGQTSSADRPAQIFVQTSVFPGRLYLDGTEVATLAAAAPSTTLDTSLGSHKVMLRSENFEQETIVRLVSNSPVQVVFFDRNQNKINK